MSGRHSLRRLLRSHFGNSNRSGHLKMSKYASGFSAFAGALFGALLMGWWGFLPCGMIAAYACLHMEDWASADRDQAEKGYWALYDRWFKHRSLWSHGPVIGTMIRLLYGYWGVPFLALWILPPVGGAWLIGALVNDLGHLILDI